MLDPFDFAFEIEALLLEQRGILDALHGLEPALPLKTEPMGGVVTLHWLLSDNVERMNHVVCAAVEGAKMPT